MSLSSVTYEQPLNENIRLFLRLEHLFNQLQYYLKVTTPQNCRLALETLLKIVDVSDRPELKAKLAQAINQQAAVLAQLECSPQVDIQKLQDILHQLDCLTDAIHQSGRMKIGEDLRQDPFLKQIRMQLNNPAGPCNFTVPAYTLWLHLPEERRKADLSKWKTEFNLLEKIVNTILKLSRDSAPAQKVVANNVFYQQSLDPNSPCQMVRISLPVNLNIYPEISVGKHRLSIRFRPLFSEQDNEHWKNIQNEFPFQLSCCRV